jgi:hypothetical protein
MIGQIRIAELDKDLGIELRSVVVLDIKLGTVLDRRCCTEVVLDIKVGSKLGAGLDRGLDTKLGLGLELGTGLDRELCTVLILEIKFGSKLGT